MYARENDIEASLFDPRVRDKDRFMLREETFCGKRLIMMFSLSWLIQNWLKRKLEGLFGEMKTLKLLHSEAA